MPRVCDGLSVGVLIYDQHDRLLMITRATQPWGVAPVAGHVRDENPAFTHLDAAVTETHEEVGLTVRPEDLVRVYSRWQPNRCGAQVPAPSGGHGWEVHRANAWSGPVVRAEREVSAVSWYAPEQVQYLADRTVAYSHGLVGEEEWRASPGLEPVWVDILSTIPASKKLADLSNTIVRVSDYRDVERVMAIASTPPTA